MNYSEIILGTVGTGNIVHWMLSAAAFVPGIRTEAAYSRDINRAKELALEYGVPKAYSSYEELLADDSINTVYIASPNNLHYEQTLQALKAGKNVLCEKPMCPTFAQTVELFEEAASRGLFLTDAVPTLFLPNFPFLKQKVSEIGRIRICMGNFSQYSARYDKLKNGELPNVFNPDFAGGCLMDINFYNLYLASALFGAPKQADYLPNRFGRIDTSGILTLSYDDFSASFIAAKDTWGKNFFTVEGEEGYVYAEGGPQALDNILFAFKKETGSFTLQTHTDRWRYELEGLVPVLQNGNTEVLEEKKRITLTVASAMETARKNAGIYFQNENLGME